MNNIEIIVESFNDYINYEQWLFTCVFFEKVNITIFCKENTETYFYTTKQVEDYTWFVVTDK